MVARVEAGVSGTYTLEIGMETKATYHKYFTFSTYADEGSVAFTARSGSDVYTEA